MHANDEVAVPGKGCLKVRFLMECSWADESEVASELDKMFKSIKIWKPHISTYFTVRK